MNVLEEKDRKEKEKEREGEKRIKKNKKKWKYALDDTKYYMCWLISICKINIKLSIVENSKQNKK